VITATELAPVDLESLAEGPAVTALGGIGVSDLEITDFAQAGPPAEGSLATHDDTPFSDPDA
jgi:hypothetical protein